MAISLLNTVDHTPFLKYLHLGVSRPSHLPGFSFFGLGHSFSVSFACSSSSVWPLNTERPKRSALATYSIGDLIQSVALNASIPAICWWLPNLYLSLELWILITNCLLDISIWISNKHLISIMAKIQAWFPPKLVYLPIFIAINSITNCSTAQGKNLEIILNLSY